MSLELLSLEMDRWSPSKGTILFAYKSREHRCLDGVYYIPRLTTSIVSVGQLDKGGFKVDIEFGIPCLYDQRRHLLAKIRRSPSRLYFLGLEVTKGANGTTLSEGAYTAKILEKAWMLGSNPCTTPMETNQSCSRRELRRAWTPPSIIASSAVSCISAIHG